MSIRDIEDKNEAFGKLFFANVALECAKHSHRPAGVITMLQAKIEGLKWAYKNSLDKLSAGGESNERGL
jgi:hypothetical protein